MNIFVLDPNPATAAAAHCDQHLHKMILESAQLVSTAFVERKLFLPGMYRHTHSNHPCTRWVAESVANIFWVCELAAALDDIRLSLSNCDSHASMRVINRAKEFLPQFYPGITYNNHTSFIFAGPDTINIRSWDIPTKYQQYYRRKHNNWLLDNGVGMTYKGRSVPDFMADLIPPTT